MEECMVVTNAISLNMLPANVAGGAIVFLWVTSEDAKRLVAASREVVSAIGHVDTARLVGQQLGVQLPADRRTVTLGGEPILVAQYVGPRLPEGATELPAGARIEFFVVALSYDGRAEAARQLGLTVVA
jgi:hypothetical protein